MTGPMVAAGIAIGIAYALSPLFVVVALGFALLVRWTRRVSDADERRILVTLLVAALALRVLAVAVLFWQTDHQSHGFGYLFGDEEYFIKRSIWLRNLGLGIPIANADALYAYDRMIYTSFVWMLAALQVVFGPSPYGVRLVCALVYVSGAYAFYRAVRPSLGLPTSMMGLALLLFLPSLFVWSISVLKEPVFFALMATVVWITMAAARQTSWAVRVLAAGALAMAAVVAQSIRDGGLVVAGVGSLAGVLAGYTFARPRLAWLCLAVSLFVVPAALSRVAVQDAVVGAVSQAAQKHWDNVNTPGHSYTVLEAGFYRTRPEPGDLTFGQGLRFVTGSVVQYLAVPTPADLRSTAELVFLPEQIVWYLLVLLAPVGLYTGFRRDRFLASVLLAHLVLAAGIVAITSGNVGTLVRHRALALPYVVWFSALGFSTLLTLWSGKWTSLAPLARAPERVEA